MGRPLPEGEELAQLLSDTGNTPFRDMIASVAALTYYGEKVLEEADGDPEQIPEPLREFLKNVATLAFDISSE